jgi:hypothetical protein
MNIKIQSEYTPVGNVFDSERLPPAEAAQSLVVWKKFIKTHLLLLQKMEPVSFSIDTDHQIVCFIQRRSPNLEFVILNSRMMLGDEWGFQLVTSPDLVPWTEDLTKDISGVKILPILKPGTQVNELMRTLDFWKEITGENLLVIDTDTIFCHGEVDKYLEYDYVAPLWRKADVSPWCRYGGGISLRKKFAMVKICSECNTNPVLIPDESIFISIMFKLQSKNYHLPEDSVASSFAVERCYNNRPFALHKAWLFIQHKQLSNILDTIVVPERATGK